METVLKNIIKKQNLELITNISKEFNLNEEEMKQKYWTPSFYLATVNPKSVYNIEYKNNEKKIIRLKKSNKTLPSDSQAIQK